MGKYKNDSVTQTLPVANQGLVFAILTLYDVDPTKEIKVWEFQFNPQTLNYSGSSNYAASQTFAAREQEQQFINSDNQTLSIPEIFLKSYHEGRSLQPMLDGIEELRKADIANAKFSPPVLSFVFGKKRFSPCVLTSTEWVEDTWLSGETASAKLKITLLIIPTPGKLGLQNIAPELVQTRLTDRQLADSSNATNAYLKTALGSLSQTVQNIIRSGQYKITTDRSTGVVTITDKNGKAIGVAGIYNKGKIDPSTSTLD